MQDVQEINNLRIQTARFENESFPLMRETCSESFGKMHKAFTSIQKLLKLEKRQRFNLEGEKEKHLMEIRLQF